MKLGSPSYLLFLWLVPGLVLFHLYAFRAKDRALARFSRVEMLRALMPRVSRRRQWVKAGMLTGAVFFVVLALARPRWGFQWEEVKRFGVDILIALDVSESMLAQDVQPNRLERAKHEVQDLIRMLEGDRVGLVAFAGVSFLQCPLTLDYGAVELFLDNLDTDLIPVPGTAIGEAIRTATAAFNRTERKSKALILITDGEDHSGDALEAARAAKKEGIKIFTIGIGKPEGAPIPNRKGGGFIKDRKGNLVLTKLDETTLQKIALETGGGYVRSVTGDLDLEKIYREEIRKIEGKDLSSIRRKRWEERFQWFLLVALLLLAFEPLVSETRKGETAKRALLLFALLLLIPHPAHATPPIEEGIALYEAGRFDEALEKFTDAQVEMPENLELEYNIANTHYQMKNYEAALESYGKVAEAAEPELAEKAVFNMGNTLYHLGRLDEAVAAYEHALELDPNDEDARHNLEFVREEIRRRINEAKKRQENASKKGDEQKQGEQGETKPQGEKGEGQQEKPRPQQGEEGEETGGSETEGSAQKPTPQPGEETRESEGTSGEPSAANAQAAAGTQQAQETPSPTAEAEAAAGRAGENGEAQREGQSTRPLTRQEAEQILESLTENQKEALKKRLQRKFGKRYRVEKWW